MAQNALTISLQENQVIALLLQRLAKRGMNSQPTISQEDSFKVSLEWGTAQTCIGQKLYATGGAKRSNEVDISCSIPKADYQRKLVSKQLFSGQIRLDLGNPMTKGNLIMFKGASNSGKTRLAYSTISEFLKEDAQHQAVYIGLTQNSGA